MDSSLHDRRNVDATVYVGNLDEKVTEDLLWELFLQMGPLVSIFMPSDKSTGKSQGFGFVEFRGEDDAEYAIKVMNMVRLYDKPIKVNKVHSDPSESMSLDVGAKLFIGNLDQEVDEKQLFDTFGAFGGIIGNPSISRDVDNDKSKGFGFINFESFEAADKAIECMNNQYLENRQLQVTYAFKKDTPGERHGSEAERLLAEQRKKKNKFQPHQHFSGGPGDSTTVGGYNNSQQMMMMSGMQAGAMGGMMGVPGMGGYDMGLMNPQQQYLMQQQAMVYQQQQMMMGQGAMGNMQSNPYDPYNQQYQQYNAYGVHEYDANKYSQQAPPISSGDGQNAAPKNMRGQAQLPAWMTDGSVSAPPPPPPPE